MQPSICAVLFQEKSSGPDEVRHLVCNTCGSRFHGISIPTRKKLLESACGNEVVDSLRLGSFLVASRANSERPLSNNFPALVAALFNLKRAHWKYGVYFVFSLEADGCDDVEGESKVFAFNLTRLMDGSADHPIPDEVLNMQQSLNKLYEQELSAIENGGGCDMCFPRIIIKHHNGGPVKWSSNRSGICVINRDIRDLQEQLRRRGFISDADVADRSGDPADVFLTSFLLVPLSNHNRSTLVIGKFSIVIDIVQSIRHFFSDGIEIIVHSFSGYAEWSTAQLLREVARGSWGVVRPETALIACEELIAPRHEASDSGLPTVEELSSVAHVASYSVSQSSFADDNSDLEGDMNVKCQNNFGEANAPDSKVQAALSHCSDDEEDVLPPIPKPARVATRGSITRARSASNVQTAAPPCEGVKDDEGQSSMMSDISLMWKEMFCDIDESNIWEKMIDISIESGDNVIRRSYN